MSNFTNLSTIVIEQPDNTMMIGLPNQVQKNEEINQAPIQSLNQNIESVERDFQIVRQEPIFNVRAETVYITRGQTPSGMCFQMCVGLGICGLVLLGFILMIRT